MESPKLSSWALGGPDTPPQAQDIRIIALDKVASSGLVRLTEFLASLTRGKSHPPRDVPCVDQFSSFTDKSE